MTKSLPNKLHLKQRLYYHHLAEGLYVIDHIFFFKGIVVVLQIMKVKYDDEDLGLILLCSLPPSYTTFNILYCIVVTLSLWRRFMKSYIRRRQWSNLLVGLRKNVKGLVVRGRSHESGSRKSERGKLKSRGEFKSWKYYNKKGHVIEDCDKLYNRNKAATNQKGKQTMNFDHISVAEGSPNDGELINVSNSNSNLYKEWVLDFGCTYHIPIRTSF